MSLAAGDTPSDAELTAFLDGELAEDRRAAVLIWLDEDPAVRARLDMMVAGGRPFRAAFDTLLDQAPYARMAVNLSETAARARPADQRRRRVPLRAVVGGAVLALVVAGLAAFAAQFAS